MLLVLVSAGVLVIPLLPMLLALVRALGELYRWLARWLLGLRFDRAARPKRQRGFLGLLVYHIGDPVAWRTVGYLAIRFPLGLTQCVLGFVWWGYSILLVAYPLLWQIEPRHAVDARGGHHAYGMQLGNYYLDTWPRALGVTLFGLLTLLAWPWVQRAPLALDRWLMPRLLGPSDTSLRLAQLTETREHAVNEAAATLRRIERDLHDGAQARMIALGMRLGRAEARLDRGDTELALALLRESRQEAKEIVQELREFVRGIHPPALDAGLEPALTTLAARSALPATVRVELPQRPPASVETMLYFATAELLTNAAKHSEAGSVAVAVLGIGPELRLVVSDDGRGGATLYGGGSGLRGLAERVRTLDGELRLDSPLGGPTTVSIHLSNPT